MNYLWPALIIISYLYAILSGNIEKMSNSIFLSISEAITLSISLMGNMCLWCGIMNIVKKTKLIDMLRKLLRPSLNIIFKDVKNNEIIMNDISINIISNILGIGNAATPAGLKAMKEMQKENKNKKNISNAMATLIVLNTASLQVIPTTVLAIRTTMNSNNPASIVMPIWISTFIGSTIALIAVKIILRIGRNKV